MPSSGRHVPDIHAPPQPGRQRIAALARQTQWPVTQMTVLDQPAVELIEQLSFLAPRRITDRPILQLGAQRFARAHSLTVQVPSNQ